MMHFHMHGGRDRGCGPRGGWDRGRDWRAFGDMFAERMEGARGGRGGRGRMFDGGELRLVLLKLIADEPRHGYDLIRAIEELTGGGYAPSPGVVYPTLTLLDEMGFIKEQQAEGAKKRFGATEAGRAHLEENREQVDALIARLRDLGEHRERQHGSPVWRAMRNLGMAVRDRQARGGFTDQTLDDVVELIDEVARKIEKLR